MTPKEYNRRQIELGKLTDGMVDHLLEIGTIEYQKKANLLADGLAGPVTQEHLAKILEILNPTIKPVVKKGLGYYPTGKGIYIRDLTSCGTPEQLVERCQYAGFKFVVIGSIWQDRLLGFKRTKRFNTKEELEKYGEAFRNAGIEVWVWGYPYPGREQEFVQAIVADALFTNAVGIILDPEVPYRKKRSQATVLLQTLLPELHNFKFALGVTSYGSVKYFMDFPYIEFASIPGTFGSPQVYDKDNNLPLTHAHEAFEGYRKYGFTEIVMSGPAFNKTPAQLNRLLMSYPTGTRGVIFWDWANLKANRRLWDAIREYQL